MATLAQVTHETRLILKILAVLAGVGMLIWIATSGYGFIMSTFFPKPPPPPEMTFGKIPQFVFSVSGNQPTDFVVNTVTGTLPQLPTDRLPVYKIKTLDPSITALQTLQANTQILSFTSGQTKITDTLYQWGSPTGQTLQYDLLSNYFDITSNYLANGNNIPYGGISDTPSDLTGPVSQFVQQLTKNLGVDLSDLNYSNSFIAYETITGGKLVPVQKPADALVARVDVVQNDLPIPELIFNNAKYDSLTIYYPKPKQSTMNFFLIPTTNSGLQIAEAHFHHEMIDTTAHATYPVKSTSQAFEDLKKGNAIIFNTGTDPTINVTDMSLGYFLGENQNYVVPIYIFTANNFTAYVPALSDTAIEN